MTFQRELLLKITRLIGRRAAKVLLLPIAAPQWSQCRTIEQGDPDSERNPDQNAGQD
jgi:hexokinase